MKIGIQPDLIGEESYSNKWAEAIRARGNDVIFLDLLKNESLKEAAQCDGIMWRWAHNPNDKQSAKQILYTLENILHIPTYPDSLTSWHFDDKISQYYLLKGLNAPIPETRIFWKQEDALTWAKVALYPVIFKLSCGAGSANVIKIENFQKARIFINKMFTQGIFPYTLNEYSIKRNDNSLTKNFHKIQQRLHNALNYLVYNDYPPLPSKTHWKMEFGYVYFQEYLNNNRFDTRISVIGDRAFGFRRMNRDNDFRASGSGKIDFNPLEIDKRCIQIAFEISKRSNFQSMAYDFLIKNNDPVICEISYAFADNAVYSCPGHWDSKLNWIEGQIWPEEAQVEDFVNRIISLR